MERSISLRDRRISGCSVTPNTLTSRPQKARKSDPSAAQINLWAQSSAKKKAAEIALLVPVAKELARKAGLHGVTVSDLRITAVQRGLLPHTASGRELSFLGAVMKEAGLSGTDQYRRSVVEASHGNLHKVYVLEEAA